MNAHLIGNSHSVESQTLTHKPGGCCRCGGFMYREPVVDLVENEMEFMAARCLQCGDVVDPVILMNRSGKQDLSSSTGRARH